MNTDNNIQIFEYEGTPVKFETGKNVMINVTEMAKSFGKKVNHWLDNQQTKEFIDAYSAKVGIPTLELIVSVKGGSNPGTWMHEDIALEFARWLSPMFAIWCNDRIKEILLAQANGIASPEEKKEIPAEGKSTINLTIGKILTSVDEMWDNYFKVINTYTTAVGALSENVQCIDLRTLKGAVECLAMETTESELISYLKRQKFIMERDGILVPTPFARQREYMVAKKIQKGDKNVALLTLSGAIEILKRIINTEDSNAENK